MPENEGSDFQAAIADILDIPGVSKKMIAAWAGVDPSSVTRWHQGVRPADPIAILQRLAPHMDRARKAAFEATASVQRREVESWRTLVGGMDPGLREHVERSGLLSSAYYVFMIWDPDSAEGHECDVAILRYFSGVWADMSRRLYNIGDMTQTVSIGERGGAKSCQRVFRQARPVGDKVRIKLEPEGEGDQALARMSIQLNLTDVGASDGTIGFIEDFGYRFRATKAIVDGRVSGTAQTNEFLGAPVVVPCRRFNLIVCIPRTSFVGSPTALSYSNRGMLPLLLKLDTAPQDEIESMLWPLGGLYEMSSSPHAPLKLLPHAHVETFVEGFPHALQRALGEKMDPDGDAEGPGISDVLYDPLSTCFLLDLHLPQPSLIHTIVWRLAEVE